MKWKQNLWTKVNRRHRFDAKSKCVIHGPFGMFDSFLISGFIGNAVLLFKANWEKLCINTFCWKCIIIWWFKGNAFNHKIGWSENIYHHLSYNNLDPTKNLKCQDWHNSKIFLDHVLIMLSIAYLDKLLLILILASRFMYHDYYYNLVITRTRKHIEDKNIWFTVVLEFPCCK